MTALEEERPKLSLADRSDRDALAAGDRRGPSAGVSNRSTYGCRPGGVERLLDGVIAQALWRCDTREPTRGDRHPRRMVLLRHERPEGDTLSVRGGR